VCCRIVRLIAILSRLQTATKAWLTHAICLGGRAGPFVAEAVLRPRSSDSRAIAAIFVALAAVFVNRAVFKPYKYCLRGIVVAWYGCWFGSRAGNGDC
jgi:hypothetical protein